MAKKLPILRYHTFNESIPLSNAYSERKYT